MESNHLPSGYEPPALTDELRPRAIAIIAYCYLLGYNKAKQDEKHKHPQKLLPL
jgi:hypothetical protein